ncbi:effector-associated constant component EACC1 [Actinoplanes sp. CA-142083]|uniref:effector-associated constant component EACC1 n=1 Tax=Actinoplanes sp. CA-142083 TaxID=3239903 RepID=UPI003D93C773
MDRLEMHVALTAPPEVDDEDLERATANLIRELRELDVDDVRRAAGARAPEGSKAIDGAALGEIAIALGAGGGALTVVVETLREWLARQGRRRRIALTIDGDTIELESATAAERAELLRAYVQRHQKP